MINMSFIKAPKINSMLDPLSAGGKSHLRKPEKDTGTPFLFVAHRTPKRNGVPFGRPELRQKVKLSLLPEMTLSHFENSPLRIR
jgi:hypothetical protein